MSEACARIVQREDPHLHATALFAPEPARSHLMVLYAFDIELSRAASASKESLIPRMRLQWWREVVEEAASKKKPKAHDVAGPLAELIGSHAELRSNIGLFYRMIDARELELDLPWEENQRYEWSLYRYQSLIWLAAGLAGAVTEAGKLRGVPLIDAALGNAFALRHAAKQAASARATMLSGLAPEDQAALARGSLSEHLRVVVADYAAEGLTNLRHAREDEGPVDRRAVPALLPVLFAERTLRLAADNPAAIFGQLDDVDRPFDGLRLAWRALTGRW